MIKQFASAVLFCSLFFLTVTIASASGNYPAADACPKEKPYYAICTSSMHSLEGWVGKHCYADKQSAQREAEAHAKKYHQGNMRWTGINQLR